VFFTFCGILLQRNLKNH